MKFSTLSAMVGASSAQQVLMNLDEAPAAWNHVKMQPGTLSIGQLNGIVKYCHQISASTCPTAPVYADTALYKMSTLGMDDMRAAYLFWEKNIEKHPEVSQAEIN